MELERWPNEDEMIAELYGGAWENFESWESRRHPEGCLVCTNGRPYGIIAEFPNTWVTTDPQVAGFGYVCVISKTHVVEPFELAGHGSAFWCEAMAVAEAIEKALRPIKMNYEIHGNTLPHLHMHLLPRQLNDAFVGRPIDLKEVHHRNSEEDIALLKEALCSLIPSES
jgi:diadenosine tetraphosphate (Ap4A) HIT family hydrolase